MSGFELDGRAWRAALFGGLVGGALDLTYAFVVYGFLGASPIDILHVIAAGWLGKASLKGGLPTAALGLVSHFFITTIAATLYVLASTRLSLLTRKPLICGPLYGICIFLAMNYVIVPLSAAVTGPPKGWYYVGELLGHMYIVGTPMALFARWGMNPSRERLAALVPPVEP